MEKFQVPKGMLQTKGVCPTISLACIIFKVGGGSPFVSVHDFQATEAHRPDR